MADPKMFTSVSTRSAKAYHNVGLETVLDSADPHKLVDLLFDGLVQAVAQARAAMARGDIATKGAQIGKAVRIIDEGLKPALNKDKGGDLAGNLEKLYEFCVNRLTYANLRNDDAALAEVVRVIEPLAQGWKEIGGQVKR
jgi:flagellar secretion chaperone FliS